jgi:hypothetical protein
MARANHIDPEPGIGVLQTDGYAGVIESADKMPRRLIGDARSHEQYELIIGEAIRGR